MLRRSKQPELSRPLFSSRLLVVNDPSASRSVLSHTLTGRGYDVEMAESGPEALKKINRAHYDLVLLDEMMPARADLICSVCCVRRIHRVNCRSSWLHPAAMGSRR